MRKIMAILVVTLILLSVQGCANSIDEAPNSTKTSTPSPVFPPSQSMSEENLILEGIHEKDDFILDDFFGIYRVIEVAWDGKNIEVGRLEDTLVPASAIGVEVEFSEHYCRVADTVMLLQKYNVSENEIEQNGVIYAVELWTDYIELASSLDLSGKYQTRWCSYAPVYSVSFVSEEFDNIVDGEYGRKHYEEMLYYIHVFDENHILLYDVAWSLLAIRAEHIEKGCTHAT